MPRKKKESNPSPLDRKTKPKPPSSPPPKPKVIGGIIQKEATVQVTINGFGQEKTSDDIVLSVHSFVTTPGEIGLHLGRTIKVGDFEFVRVDVDAKYPVYKEQIDTSEKFGQVANQIADIVSKGFLNKYCQKIIDHAWNDESEFV